MMQNLETQIRTMQMIVAALALGVVSFAVVVMVVLEPGQPAAAPTVSYVMAGLALMAVLGRVAYPIFYDRSVATQAADLAKNAKEEDALVAVAGMFQTRTIVICALLEGAAFGNLVAYMLEGQSGSLAIAAVLLAGIMLSFPTRGTVQAWLDRLRRRAEEASWH